MINEDYYYFSHLQYDGGEKRLAFEVLLDFEREPEIGAILGEGNFLVLQIEIASDDIALSERLTIVVKLAIVGLLPRPTEPEPEAAGAQVQVGL